VNYDTQNLVPDTIGQANSFPEYCLDIFGVDWILDQVHGFNIFILALSQQCFTKEGLQKFHIFCAT
jgi:hypothetical protein